MTNEMSRTAHIAGASSVDSSVSSQPFQYQPVRYFVLTFLSTFALWFAGAYVSFQEDSEGLYLFFMLSGLIAPFLVALFLIFTSSHTAMKKDFINRLVNPTLMRLNMLPVILLLMPLVVLVSILLSLPFGGSLSQLQLSEGFSFSYGFVPVLLLLLLAAVFEELGWRGYAFDSLEQRYSYLTASILFGIIWSLWHAPLIFVNNSYQYEIMHQNIWYGINFFVGTVILGIIVSWVCSKNRKSIIAAIAFHFIINISQEALAITQTTKCIETVVLAGVALALIVIDRDLFFSKKSLVDTPNN